MGEGGERGMTFREAMRQPATLQSLICLVIGIFMGMLFMGATSIGLVALMVPPGGCP